MPKKQTGKAIKSNWDARFLVNTIMGVLATQENVDGNLISGVVTAAVRGYSRAYFGQKSRTGEVEAYQALKHYAAERSGKDGKDGDLMKAFLKMLELAELGVRVEPENHMPDTKLSAGFPLDCFTEEEVTLVSEKSREHFNAKFFSSDGEPKKGMLVFDDDDGLTAFSRWMSEHHPELIHEEGECED